MQLIHSLTEVWVPNILAQAIIEGISMFLLFLMGLLALVYIGGGILLALGYGDDDHDVV